jgi:hypothetical protein
MRADKLWGYAQLARLWGRSLVISAVLVLGVAVLVQTGNDRGLGGRWFLVTGIALLTSLVLFFFLLRMWMRSTALFSTRLGTATPVPKKPRLLEAEARDWRRWAVYMVVFLFVGSAFMLLFLVGLLGTGGTAEGVVVGCIAAWGLVTLEDVRRITASEASEGRRYFAARPRPLGVGDHLVWKPAEPAGL